jgi:uncharacterized protein YndB with AHSA1/START domain
MRRYVREVTVPASPTKLWAAIADIRRWPEWNPGIQRTEHDGRLTPGSPFMLKPEGGPQVQMTIVAAEAPSRFTDLAHLPLAKMRTDHEFIAEGTGTRIRLTLEVSGLLGFLWDRLVARKEAAEFAEHSRALATFAEQRQ